MILAGCMNASVYSDYDRSNDFTKYKTFAWSPEPHKPHKNRNFDNQIIENNIKSYVNKEMEVRGYKLDISNPDIILDFDIMVEKKVQTVSTPIYNHPNNYTGNYSYRRNNQYNNGMQYQVGNRIQKISYKEGTVTIDVIDKGSNQLVWKAWAVTTLTDPETFSNELERDIHAIFNKYPILAQKKSKLN